MKQYQVFREKVILLVKGALMGIADIIPGVSGGTIALISGIYEHLILAISSVKLSHIGDLARLIFTLKSSPEKDKSMESLSQIPWNFIIPLGLGISSGVLLSSRFIPALLASFPLQMYSFFFGLILFSLSIPFRHMHKHIADFSLLIVCALLTYFITAYGIKVDGSSNLIYVLFSGALAVCAMILPGISGAYILLILGEYDIVLNALHPPFDFSIMAALIAGMAIGLFSFVRILRYVLFHHHSKSMAALTGAMVGSMYKLWPFHYVESTGQGYGVFLGMAFAGMAFIFLMEKAAKMVKDPEPPV